MTVEYALLVDCEYCLGCSACEAACMTAHDTTPDSSGIHVVKMGPWRAPDGVWQYDFVPIPSDWCDLCSERVANGKEPACVRHCDYSVISYDTVDHLVGRFKMKPKMMLYSPKLTRCRTTDGQSADEPERGRQA